MNTWNPDRPISIAELADKYPLVVRRLSGANLITDDFIECLPQPAEQTRFGVFFHALSQSGPSDDLRNDRPKVVMLTEELSSCCQDRELIEKGILIFPSTAYQLALIDSQQADPFLSGFKLDAVINRQWIILDKAVHKRLEPPILSIPSEVIIAVAKLVR